MIKPCLPKTHPSSLPDYPEVHNKQDKGLFGDACRLALNPRQLIGLFFLKALDTKASR